MEAGVSMPDPSAVHVDAGVQVGPDTTLYPGTHLRGRTRIGSDCSIGPDVVMSDCTVGDGSRVLFAHLSESAIGAGCEIGPFAYLRPGVIADDGSKIGTYVEVKNTRVGKKAKVPHLSYIGDAEIGERTNIGAGNITANYDGFRKHRTFIGAGVKTGSDCVFVAPVSIGDRAMTAAGSIITHDIPEGALGIARARQENREGFTERAEAKARAAMKRDGKGKR
jgi:bifunctional UDP-N-acetylglucosamine pyrophosphorylase/glucosamine-1-phosphate N-acetyltransferase